MLALEASAQFRSLRPAGEYDRAWVNAVVIVPGPTHGAEVA
jgi:hypothetical protein